MRLLSCLLMLLASLAGASAQAQLAPKKTLDAVRIREKIAVDASLDEPAWQTAPAATDFLYSWPTPGLPASEKTVVRLLYDDHALYVGVYCYDRQPDSIFHRITKRDALENTDQFSIILDTYRDGQNALQFGVTPDNVQFDSKYSVANADPNNDNADGRDPNWDAVWTSAARIVADGWVAELQIPYSAIRFPKQDVQKWHVNFLRGIKRRGENDSWNEIKADISGSLNQMGLLHGVRDIKAPLRLSATPYVTATANQNYNQPGAQSNSWSYPYNFGLDLKYGINEAFTLDATLIPDFSQVRSDNNVLNLSPFEVRFQENRPFFTEGTELFNKGGFFYSRRIGARPLHFWEVYDQVAENEEVLENPNSAQLLNATKVSGRTKKGLGIGVFNAVETATYATLRSTETGRVRAIETSPLTNKSVFVLDQNLKNNSSVTLINTNVLRSGDERDANVTAFLFSLKNKAQRYALSGKAAFSTRQTSTTIDNGYSSSLDFAKTSGNFLWGANYNIESDRYNTNDLGFLFSANESSGNLWANYNQYKPWWKFNNYWTGLWAYNSLLYKPGDWSITEFGGNVGANTRSFHNMGVHFNLAPWGENDYFEPRTYDFVHYYHRPSNFNIGFWYNSDHRKRMTFYLNGGLRTFAETDRRSTSLYGGARWRASDKLTLGLGLGNQRAWKNVGWTGADPASIGYDQMPAGAITLGWRDLYIYENDLEVTYSFNTRMNLAFFARHYWQKVQYSAFAELQPDGTLLRSAYTGAAANGELLHDIAVNYFNIDLVYTWRFAPGSDLLLVYKNGSADETYGQAGHHSYLYNTARLPDYTGSNNFSIKLLYYLDYEKVKHWM